MVKSLVSALIAILNSVIQTESKCIPLQGKYVSTDRLWGQWLRLSLDLYVRQHIHSNTLKVWRV